MPGAIGNSRLLTTTPSPRAIAVTSTARPPRQQAASSLFGVWQHCSSHTSPCTRSDKYYKAAKIADALSKDVHYTVDEKQRSVLLTEDG